MSGAVSPALHVTSSCCFVTFLPTVEAARLLAGCIADRPDKPRASAVLSPCVLTFHGDDGGTGGHEQLRQRRSPRRTGSTGVLNSERCVQQT